MDGEIEVPEFFICPISLQMMRDPVTAITGITYDRESIERWLSGNKSRNRDNGVAYCPVSKQPLPRDSNLTPNHTLRRLIQSWSTENSTSGNDGIPTPKPPLERSHIVRMIKDLWNPDLQIKVLKRLELLTAEKNENNRKLMAEAGVARAMLLFIFKFCYAEGKVCGLEESLRILYLIGVTPNEARSILIENDRILESLTWVLGIESENQDMPCYTMVVLETIIGNISSHVLERLNLNVFKSITWFLRDINRLSSNPRRIITVKEGDILKKAVNCALMILLETSSWSRNRAMMIESGAVFELIELELNYSPAEKRTTELALGVLSHLCSCADGRAEFLAHVGGAAVVAKRMLRVSPAADDRALALLSLVCRFSPASAVVGEMVKVGAVAKLCMVLQVDCAASLKEKAREILMVHAEEWMKSPCVDAALLTKYTS